MGKEMYTMPFSKPEQSPGAMAASAGPARLRRSKTLIIQDRDGSLLKEPKPPRRGAFADYRVDIPANTLDEHNSLIERVIAFAFDTLGARRVDVRVRECE